MRLSFLPRCGVAALLLHMVLTGQVMAADHPDYFGIQVIDEQTGRGVPLVELVTVNQLRFVTDSGGWIACASRIGPESRSIFRSRVTGTTIRPTVLDLRGLC